MQPLYAEVGITQLSKKGEELCGDQVEVVRTPDSTIIVLSDGLGSGVKANILATMTTKIASSMLRRGISLPEVVDTIAETLPVCRQRKIAYSTLHIIKITARGAATVIEFDCPPSYLLRNHRVVPFPTVEKIVAGKLIREGNLELQENDFVVAVSDGVIHAGIGGLLNLGWGWNGVAEYLVENSDTQLSSQFFCDLVGTACEGYYLGNIGDDTTIVAAKMRYPRQLTILTGPPANVRDDERIVKRFLSSPGKKVIAGGTTATIFSRVTNSPLKVDLNYYDPEVPPIGHIPNIDLVTEGVLTLNRVVERLAANRECRGKDGASLLANLLIEADNIVILAGHAVNSAHQNPNFPSHINLKSQVLGKLQQALEHKGKHVSIQWF